MKYFDICDNVYIPDRWHLGEVTLVDGTEPRLTAGVPLVPGGDLAAVLDTPGRALEFSLTSFAVPIASSTLATQMQLVAPTDIQCIPVDIKGQSGMQVVNALRVLPCLDETRSRFIKWTKDDHRSDLAGQYRQVTKLALRRSLIPLDAHIFRIKGWLIGLVVSEKMKRVMEGTGCVGAQFSEIET